MFVRNTLSEVWKAPLTHEFTIDDAKCRTAVLAYVEATERIQAYRNHPLSAQNNE